MAISMQVLSRVKTDADGQKEEKASSAHSPVTLL